jgi:hypothetical protein
MQRLISKIITKITRTLYQSQLSIFAKSLTIGFVVLFITSSPIISAATNTFPYFVVLGGDAAMGASFNPPPGSTWSFPNPNCVPNYGEVIGSWNNNNMGGGGYFPDNVLPNGSTQAVTEPDGYYGGAIQDVGVNADGLNNIVTDLNSNLPLTLANYDAPGYNPYYLGIANNYDGNSTWSWLATWAYNLAYGFYGGGYDGLPCMPDMFPSAYSTGTPLTSSPALTGNTVDLSKLSSGDYAYSAVGGKPLIIDDSNPIPVNTDITLAINGNVFIESNILYASYNPTEIPQVNVYTGGFNSGDGNVYVSGGFNGITIPTEIHGSFTAEGNTVDTDVTHFLDNPWTTPSYTYADGLYADCASLNSSTGLVNQYDAPYTGCDAPLKVVGSVEADATFLERSFGDVDTITYDGATNPSDTNASNAAEVFEYSPELWIPDAKPTACPSGDLASCIGSSYESEVSLPPSL